MAAARRFEDLYAWQLAMQLCEVVFQITEGGRAAKDPEFRNQIRDAAKAAPPLIAEGFIRFTPNEFVRYLRMARGELGEVQTRLEEARRLQYLTDDQLARACPLAARTMAVTTLLLKSKLPLLKTKTTSRPRKRRRVTR